MNAKIAHVAEVVTLDNNRQLQNVTVADKSGTAVVTLWQDDVGKLITGKTYIIENLMVKCYYGEWGLTSQKNWNSFICKTEGLSEVVEVSAQDNNIGVLKNVKIISVKNLQSFRLCPMCKNGKMDAKAQEQHSDIGVCVECSSSGLISACALHMSSQLAVMHNNNIQYHLRALGQTIAGFHSRDFARTFTSGKNTWWSNYGQTSRQWPLVSIKTLSFPIMRKALQSIFRNDIKSKLHSAKERDPYTVKKSDLSYEIDDYPAVSFPDICNYLVLQTSFYTTKQMKAYKSMEAYNYFISGWVKEIGTKHLQNNSALLIGRVSNLKCLRNVICRINLHFIRHIYLHFKHCNLHR